jgi:glutathione S-transferase
MAMMDQQLAKTAYLAGDEFSYGDIPVGIIAYRYCQLVPERPPLPNFERWYAAISARQAFKDHVGAVPLT